MSRRLLVVTYYYPPQPGSGSNRWGAMVKYLRRAGHQVRVVTAAPPGHPSGEENGVVRTGNLNSNRHLRRLLLREERTSTEKMVRRSESGSGGVMPEALWKVIVPDPWLVTWGPYALRAIRRELRREPIDCLITSSPAESTHLLGLALGRQRPAWIADFRDGWGFEPLRPAFPAALQRSLDGSVEARVVRTADLAIGVTAPIVEDFQLRLGVRGELVTNGFDPELSDESCSTARGGDMRLTLVHTGALSGPRGRDPRPLLIALRRLVDAQPHLVGRVELVVAGRSEEDEQALIQAAGLDGVVRHLGYLPRSQALALQRQADALLLITSRDRCEATGKLYEYMAARRPIIALANGNEAARIVAETNTGVLVDPDNVDSIAQALRAAVDGKLERSYAPRAIECYAYPALAERMEEMIERTIRQRSSAASEPAPASDRHDAGAARRSIRHGPG